MTGPDVTGPDGTGPDGVPAEQPGRHRDGHRRLRPSRTVSVLAALALAAGLGTGAVLLSQRGDRPAGSAAAAPGGPGTTPGGGTSPAPPAAAHPVTEGPPAPARGAYFGAWVVPQPFTQPGRIASVQRFQAAIGRTLDIVHLYRTWTQPFGTPSDLAFARQGSYLLLSWAGVDTRRIASGAEDAVIREHARQVRAVPAKVFVEWRWEMDRPNLAGVVHSPADFIRAWTRIRSIFAGQGVRNVGWVWCPTAAGFATGRAQPYYPGDAQVDWLCADVYPETPWVPDSYEPFGPLARPFLNWAAGRDKPVMIGEYGVPRSYGPRRAGWLAATAEVVRAHPLIKAMVYFAEDPPGKPAYSHLAVTGDPAAAAALRRMAGDPWFNPPRPR